MVVESTFPNGLKTSVLTSEYKTEYDENLALLDAHLGNISDPHKVTMSQIGDKVNALDFSNVDPTGASESTGLQSAFDTANNLNRPLYLPAGTYLINTGLTSGGVGTWQILGDGRRTSVIKAGAAITMLNCVRETSKSGSTALQDIGFNGDDLATTGLDYKNVNFSRLGSVEIRNVNGNGFKGVDIEDIVFVDFDVRDCGDWTNQLAGVDVGAGASQTNSLVFLGGTIERNKYHNLQTYFTRSLKLIGTKVHGRIPLVYDTTPNEIDLIYADRCERLQVIGCQLVHANRNAITFTGNISKASMTVTGTAFEGTTNYQGTLQSEVGSISSSSTTLSLNTSGSWSVNDAIRITGAGSSGDDLYTYIVSVDSTGTGIELAVAASTTVSSTTIYTVNAAWNIKADNRGHVHADGNIFAKRVWSGEEHSSYLKTGGDIQLNANLASFTGNNTHLANPDTLVDRNGMSGYKISTKIGNFHFWVDSTGAMRLKNGPPTSDLDGSLV